MLFRALVLHPLLQPEEANQRVRVFAMIETAEAIRNIDSILDVPGLDGIFVGKMKQVTVQFEHSRNTKKTCSAAQSKYGPECLSTRHLNMFP